MQVQAKVSKRNVGGEWIDILVSAYHIQALVFGEDSEEYGINGGCISKLWITENGTVVYNWDRGEDINRIDAEKLEILIDVIRSLDTKTLTKGYSLVSVP